MHICLARSAGVPIQTELGRCARAIGATLDESVPCLRTVVIFGHLDRLGHDRHNRSNLVGRGGHDTRPGCNGNAFDL
jgi:hypothetical protein